MRVILHTVNRNQATRKLITEDTLMCLERGRVLVQGIMTLVFVAVAYWVSLPIGLAMLAFMGVMKIQESFTDFCPSDLVLKLIGLKRKAQMQ